MRAVLKRKDIGHVNVQLKREVIDRLNYACEQRSEEEAVNCPQAKILTELLMTLPPRPPRPAKRKPARRASSNGSATRAA